MTVLSEKRSLLAPAPVECEEPVVHAACSSPLGYHYQWDDCWTSACPIGRLRLIDSITIAAPGLSPEGLQYGHHL
jgi:hypothetical protein